jgi:hypothetical protein
MSWFQRHLNWTLLTGLFVGLLLYSTSYTVSSPWYILLRLGAVTLMLITQVWYLIRKKRSLWWLALNLLGGVAYAGGAQVGLESTTPFAGLLMLCLRNKRTLPIVKETGN